MQAEYICHPDFEYEKPVNVFHKEIETAELPPEEPKFQNRHILFRRKKVLDHIHHAVLKITADDYYKLYINGTFVTQGPASGYPQAYYYNEVDVTEFLQEGENTFAVHTYYQGLINRVWVSGDRRQMLYFSLWVDGQEVLVSDRTWLCADHTGYTACGKYGYDTGFAECYDSGAPEENFFQPDFDDSTWQSAAIFQNADYVLKKQPTKQLEIYRLLPRKQEKTAEGLRIDFGLEAAGYLYVEAKGHRGDTVTIRCSEEKNPDGSVRYQLRCNCCYEEKWILSGGNDTLRQFDYKGFRYAELIFPESVSVSFVAMTVRHYPYTEQTVYKTQNQDLKRILRLCADTVKYGTQESFIDCPTREKGQYLGDVSIAARAHTVLTGSAEMMKKAITDFCESAFICSGLMAVSGAALMQEIADYSLQLPAQILWVYGIDKDVDFVQWCKPYVTGMYHHFLKYVNADGLLEQVTDKWNLVDWPENLRDGYEFALTKPIGSGVHNVLNAFWCGFLEAVSRIYTILGCYNEAEDIKKQTERAKTAFIQAFYSPKTALFCDTPEKNHSAVHSVILPLLFDIGTEDPARKQRMLQWIAKKGLQASGVYMAYFALAALIHHGERELAERLALDKACWLNMLEEGATTTFEAWGKEQKWNTSLFHPWAVAPLIVFAEGVAPY